MKDSDELREKKEAIALKWLNKFRYSSGGVLTAEIPGALVRELDAIQAHYQPQVAGDELEIVREIFFKHRHTCGKPGDVCSCFDRQEADMVIREMVQLLTERQHVSNM